MRFLAIIILFIALLSSNLSIAGDGFRRPFQLGDYYEYEFRNYDGYVQRYWGRVILDSLSGARYYSRIAIYNEPPMNYQEIPYMYDTLTKKIYGYSVGYCPELNGYSLEGGFNLDVGYVWNTCHDTTGGIYFKSIISDSGTDTGILQSGLPLKVFTRSDTIGAPIDFYNETVFSEMFGYLYFYTDGGSPFGPGWCSKELKGAIIDGVIYGSITLKALQISSEIPNGYSLSQNYPNPFNPATTISFDIPTKETVRLVVYDQLGREVRELVNETLSPGSYEYQFTANNIPSGLYYYTLQTGSYSQTKKMLLVK